MTLRDRLYRRVVLSPPVSIIWESRAMSELLAFDAQTLRYFLGITER
jgi:hypothetical protein